MKYDDLTPERIEQLASSLGLSDSMINSIAAETAGLKPEDIKRRLVELRISQDTAAHSSELSDRHIENPIHPAVERQMGMPKRDLKLNCRCAKCGMDNSEIAKKCTACDAPLARIQIVRS